MFFFPFSSLSLTPLTILTFVVQSAVTDCLGSDNSSVHTVIIFHWGNICCSNTNNSYTNLYFQSNPLSLRVIHKWTRPMLLFPWVNASVRKFKEWSMNFPTFSATVGPALAVPRKHDRPSTALGGIEREYSKSNFTVSLGPCLSPQLEQT